MDKLLDIFSDYLITEFWVSLPYNQLIFMTFACDFLRRP